MRNQIEIVNYRLRPWKALFLFVVGFAFGGLMIPDYLAVRHAHLAGLPVPCVHQHPLPPPVGRPL